MTVLWPRYAREDFIKASSAALKTITDFVSLETQAYVQEKRGPNDLGKIRAEFAQRLEVLRNLLQAGTRESVFFAARLSNYNAFLVSLISLFHGALFLPQSRLLDLANIERMPTHLPHVITPTTAH